MKTVILVVAALLLTIIINLIEFAAKVRKFQRGITVGMAVKLPKGKKWTFGTVKSVNGELILVANETGEEWAKRGSCWPIAKWDKTNANI